ncbi:MAG: prepilin-type N-terminal cleavage/methylation domain-containing protein [Bradymonadales bacterium]|nr:prepilin-type N-terminal cleavage/methylation domain-containing protein [Bradymonadales bacterium]
MNGRWHQTPVATASSAASPAVSERRPSSPSAVAGSAGFTLVEVLISLTILATMMAIMWGAFGSAFRLRDQATAKYERLRTVQATMRRMQREISMAFVTKIGETPTNLQGEVTYTTAFIGESDRLDFTNFAHVRTRVGEAACEQAEISYFLRRNRGPDGRLRQDLMRREQAPIDDDPEQGGVVYTMLEDVNAIEFEYWRPDREIAGDAWEWEWDTRDNEITELPPRVRVTIEIPHPVLPRDTLTFSVQSEIHLTQPIGFATPSVVADQGNAIDPNTGLPIDNEATTGRTDRSRPTIDRDRTPPSRRPSGSRTPTGQPRTIAPPSERRRTP